jgi:hypothetical protein
VEYLKRTELFWEGLSWPWVAYIYCWASPFPCICMAMLSPLMGPMVFSNYASVPGTVVLRAARPTRQARGHHQEADDYVVPGDTGCYAREQPRGGDQPETEQQVQEPQRSCDLGHGADGHVMINAPVKWSLSAIAPSVPKIGRENISHAPSAQLASRAQSGDAPYP